MRITGTAAEIRAFLSTFTGSEVTIITGESGPEPKGAKVGRPAGRPGRPPASEGVKTDGEVRPCAVIGCASPVRSKGYCAAHYQKFNNLKKTGRAEQYGWKEDADPGTVENVTLPRGRAGAEAKESAQGELAVVAAVPPRIRRAK